MLPELSVRTREQALSRAAEKPLDLIVVGGGITGACLARDAAMRNLTVALFERGDLAQGTSSRSSKLVHGGLRYLEHMELGLVYGALTERERLLKHAPGVVRRLPFLIPMYKGARRSHWLVRAGLTLYDALSMARGGRHRTYTPEQTLARVPGLRHEGLRGCIGYADAATDDARLVAVIAADAAGHGALIATRAPVEKFIIEGGGGGVGGGGGGRGARGASSGARVLGVRVRDRVGDSTIEVRAKAVINTTGPWADRVRAMADPGATPLLISTKGAHLIIPSKRVSVDCAVVMFSAEDGRGVYVLPYAGQTLLGTTDTPFAGDLDRVTVDAADRAYLLKIATAFFPDTCLCEDDILDEWAGLRPLLAEEHEHPSDISRKETLAAGPPGFYTLVGGKLTTSRKMAQSALDKVIRRESLKARPCRTALEPLLPSFAGEAAQAARLAATWGLELPQARYLVETYGAEAGDVLAPARQDSTLLSPIVAGHPPLRAQVLHSARRELAIDANTFLHIHGRAGLSRAAGAAQAVTALLAAMPPK